ncbi:MAG: hypothetical protein M3Y75_06365 [Actinomycetota bacterium]|nr:hypothetical protein [Actinomycetota bacterium]
MLHFKVALTAAYGAFLGAWVYTEQKNSGGLFGDLHSSIPFELFVLGFAIAVGFAVRRWWALLALLGPLLALGYLQVTGYVSPWRDGAAPLLSPPGIAFFVWFGLALSIGIALGRLQGIASSAKTARWSEPGSSSTS